MVQEGLTTHSVTEGLVYHCQQAGDWIPPLHVQGALSTGLCCQEDVSPDIGDRQIRPAKRKSVKLYPWIATLLDPPAVFIAYKDSLNKHRGIAFLTCD